MVAGWKTLDTHSKTLSMDLLQDDDLDEHCRDYRMDTTMRLIALAS